MQQDLRSTMPEDANTVGELMATIADLLDAVGHYPVELKSLRTWCAIGSNGTTPPDAAYLSAMADHLTDVAAEARRNVGDPFSLLGVPLTHSGARSENGRLV